MNNEADQHPPEEIDQAPNAPTEQSPAPTGERPGSNLQLRKSMELFLNMAVTPPEVEGLEHVEHLDPNDKVIVVVSHVSGGPDLDMPVAIGTLAPYLNLIVSNQSTHHHLTQEPGVYPSIKLAGGKKNFIPIGYHRDPDTKQKAPDMFDPAEAEAMIVALNQGRCVVVAANTPHPDEKADEETKVEAAKPGYMAAYLAAKTGATILPVGVWVGQAEPGKRRRPAKVAIGEPFKLDESAREIGELSGIMERRANGTLEESDIEALSKLVKELREQSRVVFDTVMAIRPHGEAPVTDDPARQQAEIQQARQAVEDATHDRTPPTAA